MFKEETEKRLKGLTEKLKEKNLKACLISSTLNIYYFTGLWVKGLLLVSERPILFLKRPELTLEPGISVEIRYLQSLKELPSLLEEAGLKEIGLEFGAFSYTEGQKIKDLLNSSLEVEPIDEFIWELRMIKSASELSYLKKAGRMLARALRKALRDFYPGMRELKASAELEKALRELGHPGYTRSANGFELTFGYLISGKEGLYPIPFTTGEGGRGVAGFPGGASIKPLRRGEPILIDFSGFYRGYYVDQTRMASFGKVKGAEPFFKLSLKILETLEREACPGMPCGELFTRAFELVKQEGLEEYFMHHGERLSFIGHGVGLQIDEPPVLTPKNKVSLKENMVLALEPKFHVPELGVIGLEDTFVVTKRGLKRITTFPRKWIYL